METSFPLLAFAKTEILHEFGGGVAEPSRNRFVHGFFSEVESGKPGVGGGTGFFRESEGDRGMGEDKAGFWHTDTFDSLKTSGGET